MKYTISATCVLLCLFAGTVLGQTAPNLLADPSFEEWSGDTSSTNWLTFGNVICESTSPRTKSYMVKIYGNFKNETNSSGIYQDAPASEGKCYEASAYLRQNSDDHLAGANEAWVKLEFFNSDRSIRLVTFASPVKMDAKSPSKKYMFISTGPAVAPKGTAFARAVVLIQQGPDNALGAVIVDDVSLKMLP
jgi:hypothetical protein